MIDLEAFERDWQVTPEKIREAVRRIVEACDPLQVILFGSQARGDQRPDSDADIAIILDRPESEVNIFVPYAVTRGLKLRADLITVSKDKFDLHRPWLNSVFNYIDQEGIILYDRDHPERAGEDALQAGEGRRVSAQPAVA